MRYDVVVVGGGPSGIAAAIYAAKNGAATLLIEEKDALGGAAAHGLLNDWSGGASCGLFQELEAQTTKTWGYNLFDPREWVRGLWDRLDDYSVHVATQTLCYAAKTKQGYIRGLKLFTPQGKAKVKAHCYIDATGTGALGRMAGVPMSLYGGNATPDRMIRFSVRFGGINTRDAGCYTETAQVDLEEILAQGLAQDDPLAGAENLRITPSLQEGLATVSFTFPLPRAGRTLFHGGETEWACRARELPLLHFLREYAPGFRNAFIIDSASTGTEQGQPASCACQHTLQTLDLIDDGPVYDWVVSRAQPSPDLCEEMGISENGFTVPFRTLVPLGVENLLMCGRAIDVSDVAQSLVFNLPLSLALGQAAGTAAALAVREETDIGEISPLGIQETLLAQGVLPPVNPVMDRMYADIGERMFGKGSPVAFAHTAAQEDNEGEGPREVPAFDPWEGLPVIPPGLIIRAEPEEETDGEPECAEKGEPDGMKECVGEAVCECGKPDDAGAQVEEKKNEEGEEADNVEPQGECVCCQQDDAKECAKEAVCECVQQDGEPEGDCACCQRDEAKCAEKDCEAGEEAEIAVPQGADCVCCDKDRENIPCKMAEGQAPEPFEDQAERQGHTAMSSGIVEAVSPRSAITPAEETPAAPQAWVGFFPDTEK